ncbi:MAG: hypothetical protein AMXMBFR34_27120 [Myxococcaceae bacterium]
MALFGCTQSQPSVTLKLPAPKPSRSALGGTPVNGAAQFDAPIIDPNTWSGQPPAGTGSYTIAATPTLTGGPASISASDQGFQYVVIGNFNGNTGTGLAVLSDLPWALGSSPLDGVHRFALIFDVATGDTIGEASSGTITLTAAGAQLNQRVTGSLSGSFVMYPPTPPPPGCQSNADCARGEVCQAGVCVVAPSGCTSNAQCAAGQVCQAGQCVTPPPPGCVVDADCAPGEACQAGVCVTLPPPGCVVDADCAPGETCSAGLCVRGPAQCTSNAQCAPGETCQAGVCVPPSPACTSNVQCPRGWVCQAGQCVSTTPPGTCGGQQGSGGYSGGWGGVAQCTAAGSGSVGVSNGQAWIDDSNGTPALIVADPSSSSAGVVIELGACPSGAGQVAIQAGDAALYAEVPASADTQLFVAKAASGGTITFSAVGAVTAGSFQLTFSGGGTVSGSFTVQ